MIPQPGADGLYAGYPKSVLFDFGRNATTLTSEAIDLAEASPPLPSRQNLPPVAYRSGKVASHLAAPSLCP